MKLWIKRMFVSNSPFQMFPMKLKLSEKKTKNLIHFFSFFIFLFLFHFVLLKRLI